VIAVDGSDETDVSSNGVPDDFPTWSPDGRWIVFTRRADHGEIYVMRPDGTG
jgi:Tol biopolymer transport system component